MIAARHLAMLGLFVRFLRLCAWLPTSFLRHVGETPLSRHRFCAMSGNTSIPASFLRHVGETPLSRPRFCAMSGYSLCSGNDFAPCGGNACVPPSIFRLDGACVASWNADAL